MNVLVVGLGSMGKRRIRLLVEMYPEFTIYGVDGRRDRRDEVKTMFSIDCFENIDAVAEKKSINVAFVCTSPKTHSSLIKECLKNKFHVFTELNLISDGYNENLKLSIENNCKLFLSSTFLYREEIRYLQQNINNKNKWNYIYHVGQYLPDWHPWESYKDFFISDKRTNGCREIMAIELPWIVKVFGDIETYNVISDKITSLDIDYKDNYMLQIVHSNGNKGMITIDVVSPVAVRNLEVYTENKYYKWSGSPDTLLKYDNTTDGLVLVDLQEEEERVEGYRKFVVENAYRNEIKEFFDFIIQGKEPIYSFEEDMNILDIIDKVEEIG